MLRTAAYSVGWYAIPRLRLYGPSPDEVVDRVVPTFTIDDCTKRSLP